jgi:hypothetical protein
MASWDSLTIKFSSDPLDALRPPLQALLSALEALEAILEPLLDLLKNFLIDLINALRAAVALILAAIRAIINQILSTGVASLLIRPQFELGDLEQAIYSVAGAYPGFESALIGKFYDEGDIFRPQFPPGSFASMLILYIGADSPGDLLLNLFALIRLLRDPIIFKPPPPIELRAVPVQRSGEAIVQFRNIFNSDLDNSLVVEWKLLKNPRPASSLGLFNALATVYNSFVIPNFIIERSQSPNGRVIFRELDTTTVDESVRSFAARVGYFTDASLVPLREEDGSVYRHFETKVNLTGANASTFEGALTGTFRYVDRFTELKNPQDAIGKPFYYRVRSYFGDASNYLSITGSLSKDKPKVKQDQDKFLIAYGPNNTLGRATLSAPSNIARGVIYKTYVGDFNPFESIVDAIRAGVLLNFDKPYQSQVENKKDPEFISELKTGYGTLSLLEGYFNDPISGQKVFNRRASSLIDSIFFKTATNRLANIVIGAIYKQSRILDVLNTQWSEGVGATVKKVLNFKTALTTRSSFQGPAAIVVDYGFDIDALAAGDSSVPPEEVPPPVEGQAGSFFVTVDEREALASFLRLALTGLGGTGYFPYWRSITLADLLPPLHNLLFNIDQFLAQLLNAVENALKAITDIIEQILQKIRALEQLIRAILELLDMLNIEVKASVLFITTDNGVDGLVEELKNSENKPGTSNFGLHSGLILVGGAPVAFDSDGNPIAGPGLTAASDVLFDATGKIPGAAEVSSTLLDALSFLFGFGSD